MAIDTRFETQARDLITESIKQVLPDTNVGSGSAINNLLARAGSTIMASALQEIEHVSASRDLSDPTELSEADMDLILENLLTARVSGDKAMGFVRLDYRDRVRRVFAAGLLAADDSKTRKFATLDELTYMPQDYFFDSTTQVYYLNVPFVAVDVGVDYNVEPGEITQLLNDLSGPARVTNASSFKGGKAKQDNTEALRQARRAVSTRMPVSTDGCIYWLQQLFGSKLRDLLIVGNGDSEMVRDELVVMPAGYVPQYRIGVDGLDPVTRTQLGTLQGLHVGGRTDVYMLMSAINYIQQHVDLFADMTLDAEVTPASTSVMATIVTGTTGQVASAGKLILDLGSAGEETLYYRHHTAAPGGSTYAFDQFLSPPTQVHAQGATVKVVNNGELVVGEEEDITILPVFQISEIRLLDPLTFEPVGEPIAETTEGSREPGWYVSKTSRYDILSAREIKSVIMDEKRDVDGNSALSGSTATIADVTIAGIVYTQLTHAGIDFSHYQSREITLGGGATPITPTTRTIIVVVSPTQVMLSGPALGTNTSITFTIADYFQEFIEYPVRVSYYTHTEIAEAQEFFDQDPKRTIAGDTLARAFMPVFLDFTMKYRGEGDTTAVRDNLNEIVKSSSGEAIGESTGSKFDYSDLINAAYQNGAATYVQTPFEVRVRRLNADGTWTTSYLNPGPTTVNTLAVRAAPVTPSSFLEARRPESVDEFTVPARGKLYLGAFTGNQEVVDYESVIVDEDEYTFVLLEGQTIDLAHAVDEPLRVATVDYDDDNVITDGVITDERDHRPFLGQVIIEKLT